MGKDNPLVGKIYFEKEFISEEALSAKLGKADYVLLGEVHDNPDRHRLQALLLKKIVDSGKTPALVDVDVFALQNAFEVNYETPPANIVALINFGASVTNISVLLDGHSIFWRDISVGGNRYTEAIQRAPENPLPYMNRAAAFADQDRYDEAIADCAEAIGCAPDHGRAYFCRGTFFTRQDMHEEAIADSTYDIENGSAESFIYMFRATTYEKIGDIKSALADYRKALELAGDDHSVKAGARAKIQALETKPDSNE